MNIEPLGQEIGSGLVASLLRRGKGLAGGFCHRLVALGPYSSGACGPLEVSLTWRLGRYGLTEDLRGPRAVAAPVLIAEFHVAHGNEAPS